MSARAQRQAQTDPSEVAPLNAIFWRWGLRASEAWNISGEPCGGAAIDNTDIDNNPNFNPAIKVRLLLQHQHSLPHHQDGFSAELLDWIFASVSWKAHSVAVSRKSSAEIGASSARCQLSHNFKPATTCSCSEPCAGGSAHPPMSSGSIPRLRHQQRHGSIYYERHGAFPNWATRTGVDAIVRARPRTADAGSSNRHVIRSSSTPHHLAPRHQASPKPAPLHRPYVCIERSDFTASGAIYINLPHLERPTPPAKFSETPGYLTVLIQWTSRNLLNSILYSSFAVDSGGSRPIRASDNSIYEPDDASLQLASYYVTNSTRWGVSNIGRPMDSMNESYIVYTSRRFTNTLDSELFQTARMSPSSLRYYGIGLKNGMYNVVLQFAEIYFPDDQTWISLGKRIFNIYVQVNIFLNILTNGRSYTVVQKQYIVEVTNNFIDIHLFWAGKGTCCIPIQGFYGPSISALSVSSYGSNGEGVPGPQKSKTSKIGLVVGVVVCVAVLGFLALAWAFVWRQKRRKLEMEMEELFSIVGRPNVFSYGEIKSATDSFSPANILGRGGYGLVYKGKLLDGRMVAVKQLSSTSHQGKKEFMTEIATISTVQHRNLVKLHGCCIDSKTPLLVYEYLEQGSLNQAILGKIDLNLDWRTRFEICVGIARGLAYLHEESSMRIVHRDIKASNVLLDADLNPKISDFGLSRHYKDSMTHLNTGVAGTLGYLAPEYAMMGHLTEKADVFAFGVVALEIIAVRRNFDDCLEEDEKYLLGCAWHLQESHRTLELLDSKVAEFDEEEAARLINVALLCTMGLPQRRPAMSKVVAMLTEDIEMTDGRGQHHEA
uniref:non-specific serine/threonine protein kinase n=1 Tax=Triticum aestivum TaxID=4565 RepID=A0A077RZ34_WHEAT|nr:unnamed protein product [Triticum aestivum]